MTRLLAAHRLLSRSVCTVATSGSLKCAWPASTAVQAATALPGAVAAAAAAAAQAWRHHSPFTVWQHASFSSQSGSSSGSRGSSGSDEGVVDQLNSMMEVMMSNPAMQQMMLSRLPPHMRKPEVLRAMMANQEVRQRIAALAQQTGLGQMLSQLDASKMAAGMSASSQAGLDPTALFERFSSSPSLSTRMQDPRVLAALMDMASNGPDALKKYSGDKDVVEAAMEAGDIIQQMQQEQAGGSSSPVSSGGGSSGGSSNGMSAVEAQLGMSPEVLMQRLMSRPDLLEKVQDPKVQQALQEVAQSPWKIVKYLFNKDVMDAIKAMKSMLQEPPRQQ